MSTKATKTPTKKTAPKNFTSDEIRGAIKKGVRKIAGSGIDKKATEKIIQRVTEDKGIVQAIHEGSDRETGGQNILDAALQEMQGEAVTHVIGDEAVTIYRPLEQAEMLPIAVTDTQGILSSKRYVKGGAEYKSPSEILEPVISLLNSTGGKLSLTGTQETANANHDGTKNISFGRLNLVASYPIDAEMYYEIGVLIAYDLQIPKVKIYRGPKVSACTNLCVFSADDVVKFDIAAGVNLETVQKFLKSQVSHMENCINIVRQLKAIPIAESNMREIIGAMTIRTISEDKLNGTTSIIRAVELLTNDKSKYYYKQEGFNAWQLYNSFTEYFSDKINFFDIPEKTRDTYELLKDICLQ